MTKKMIACGMLVTALLLNGSPARAAESETAWADFGYGVAAVALNFGYIPAKILYAGAGGLVGGLALAVTGGNMAAADEVWAPTLGGDYVVTSDNLRGDKPLHFVGDWQHEKSQDF